ncbi:putative ribonuclease p/mrp subunit [Danaus plexippus plexippus]|uniref:Ribonuclease p/mrp subunit n=1 Tax=Danaus plexippus plexippus TaxID=278856 RepID=A0A212EZT3_DANPL|nr:putative ribonuclease p/mrp subunit [Danaus plexippus plexippus]
MSTEPRAISRSSSRWCVSSFWSSATLLLHRLITTPAPTAPKPKPRPANYDHLHPEPLVDCSVLYSPDQPEVDVIFVHGLYGSLANTWRQGEWRSRYQKDIRIVPLRRPHSTPTCTCTDERTTCGENAKETGLNEKKSNETSLNETGINEGGTNEIIEEDAAGVKNITKDDLFITEKFYTNHQIEIMNYDTQAQFVRDLFDMANEVKPGDCKCEAKCEAGCGCLCDKCYSPCWPRDWLQVDYPGARVISINYTSDPYLWRPLWIKPSQRLRLHERADQMITQLLALGVGRRPIIWVGHSKGGLFIKHIYCEAYDAFTKQMRGGETESNKQNTNECNNDNRINHCIDKHTDNETGRDLLDETNENDANEIKRNEVTCNLDNIYNDAVDCGGFKGERMNEEILRPDLSDLPSIYQQSAGFMFYSVPHRGSPLADIKTPVTARSVELLEICKDCDLVMQLHERWRVASSSLPPVRSLVETDRTLMSLLYLRIVSVDSADPGVGALHGVSVDHREICKPTSRRCILYQELMTLMSTALQKYTDHGRLVTSQQPPPSQSNHQQLGL